MGRIHNVAQASPDAPSTIAAKRVGKVFGEYDTDSLVTIVLEGEQPLGDDAHRFGDDLVERLRADTAHVQHVQYFWGDPLTAAGAQSNDGKAAQIQVYLAGDAGGSQANGRSPRSAKSSPTPRRRPESRPTSPVRRPWSPTSSRSARKAISRSPR